MPQRKIRIKRVVASAAAIVVVSLLAMFTASRLIPLHIYDGFESPTLSWRWITLRLAPGAAQPEQQIVRAGRQALALTVHSGDRHEDASDTGAATERAEIMESWWLFSRTGRTYVYSWSLFLPNDLPSSAERLVIAQWRQVCEARRCRPDNPVLAIRYQQGQLLVTRQDDQGRSVLYQSTGDYRGKWLDFRFVTRFDAHQGSIDATLNGATIIQYKGPTVFDTPGYPANGLVYFKSGLYRDALNNPPWTIYVDEYRKDQCPAEGCR
jgi:Polysaccharide lyase